MFNASGYTTDEHRFGVIVYRTPANVADFGLGRKLDREYGIPNLAGYSDSEGFTIRVLPENVERARAALEEFIHP